MVDFYTEASIICLYEFTDMIR